MLVLDTSTLFFWTLDPDKLSLPARLALDREEERVISTISIWEIALKVSRGSLEIPMTINEYASALLNLSKLEIRPVETDTWLENVALDWEHRDPADRTIVALARQLNCDLVSNDRKIAAFYPRTIW
jgi:PIN domain nuclease of toxin-antitoxin system